MKYVLVALAVFTASSATAQVAGAWRVSGKVSSLAFTVDCDFKGEADKLGGVCVDVSTSSARLKAGKSHAITAGSLHGGAVSWTYRSSFVLSQFDVTYKGVVTGDRMSGSIDASGHEGTFSAVRR